jgi:hypothetical protein
MLGTQKGLLLLLTRLAAWTLLTGQHKYLPHASCLTTHALCLTPHASCLQRKVDPFQQS